MTKVIALYVVANEEHSIRASIRSVKAYVDGIVIIDSIFTSQPPDYAKGLPHSSDSTMWEARRAAVAVDPKPVFAYHQAERRLSEPEARNLGLTYVEDGDWILIIDGDEILYGDHAHLQDLFDDLRATSVTTPASDSIDVGVFTTAIAFPGMAPDIDVHTYAYGPLISTLGYMPRLVRKSQGLHYTVAPGMVTPALTRADGTYVGSPEHRVGQAVLRASLHECFILNDHVRQSYQGYQDDYVWETAARRPVE